MIQHFAYQISTSISSILGQANKSSVFLMQSLQRREPPQRAASLHLCLSVDVVLISCLRANATRRISFSHNSFHCEQGLVRSFYDFYQDKITLLTIEKVVFPTIIKFTSAYYERI